jgi:hypothetical protein
VCISFTRPFVLDHSATRARRQRGCCTNIFFVHNI